MVQSNRTGSNRVTGRSVGNMTNAGSSNSLYNRGLTPEQKAQRDKETQASYEVWRSAREARKSARFDALRARNLGRDVVTQDPS